ncbi:MAG TPA: hypothetical protein VGH33_01375, partial [Isosphaeraceae bacterium]
MGALRRWSVAVLALVAPVAPAAADDPPGAVIRGTVVDEEGRPVPGATVDMVGRQSLSLVDHLEPISVGDLLLALLDRTAQSRESPLMAQALSAKPK